MKVQITKDKYCRTYLRKGHSIITVMICKSRDWKPFSAAFYHYGFPQDLGCLMVNRREAAKQLKAMRSK
jgi:hypothetical protein